MRVAATPVTKIVPALLLTLGVGVGCERPAEAQVLRVAFLPDVDPDRLKEEGDRMAAWLAEAVGRPVRFDPVQDYNAAVAAVVSGSRDLVWLGGVTTVRAMALSEGGVRPLVTRASDRRFRSYFVVGENVSQAQGLEDLGGLRFCFGPNESTSGHVMPRHFLQQRGLDPDEFFASVAYSIGHEQTVRQVQAGVFDAGVLNFKVYETLVADGTVDPERARVLWKSPEYVDYSWSARTDLGEETLGRIRSAFLALDRNDPEDAQILALQSAARYVAAEPSDWDGVRAVLQSLEKERD